MYDSVRYDGQSGWFTVGGTSVGAPSWAGLIAIADQGLALNGVGSLSNAQSSLYSVSTSDYHDILTGSNGAYKAGPGYDLVTGIGSPVANNLVPALVSLNTPDYSAPPVFSPALAAPRSAVGFLAVLTTNTSDSAIGTGSQSASSATPVAASSSIAITPLNANTTSTTVAWTVAPVMIVPAPLPPIATHLGSSSAPATTQSTTEISLAEEQPTSLTHFGQGFERENPGIVVERRRDARLNESFWIDTIESDQPVAPVEPHAPRNAPALPKGAWRDQALPNLSPAAVDAVLELFDTRELTGSFERSSSQAGDAGEAETPTWNFSAFFGAAAIASGGYRLAIRAAKRRDRRWIPSTARRRSW